MRKLTRTGSLSCLVVCLALACTAVQAAPPPCTVTSIEATYPKIVQSGVPAQLWVTLYNGTNQVECDGQAIDIATTDHGLKKPTELLRNDGRVLFELALRHGPTQSVTVKVGQVSTTISGIQVRSDSRSVEPGISTFVRPGPKQLVAIPTNNTVIDDAALDGGISLGGKIYFFGSNGKGGKLYSYDPVEGVKQRSNTNPTGPDHQWVGGFRAVNGVLYFNAFSDKGCIKIYKYAPGDPMVTKPIDSINDDECNPIPDQIATVPDTDSGNGQAGSIPFNRGHDTPLPRYFAPIGLGTKVYFVASNGSRYDVYEYDQKKSTRAITNLPTPVVSPTGLFLLGIDANQLVFAAPGGIYRYTPGGPPLTAPTTPGAAPVGIEVATGILLDNVNYFELENKLVRWTIGDVAPTILSDTNPGSLDYVLDLGVIDGNVVFSAIRPGTPDERRIYAYTPGGPAPVTTPLVDTCSSPCSEPSTPVGLIGGQFYFNGRDPSKGLKFYKTSWPASSDVSATPAFTVNTAPMSYVFTSATLDDSVYFVAHEGFVGYLHSAKYPNYGFQRGNGRSGYGKHQLFVLPAGATQAQQVFDTVDVDIDGDDVATGSKYPSLLTRAGNRMYFRARTDTVPENPEPEYGLFSHAPGEGMATVKINADFRVPIFNQQMLGIGNALYFIGDVGTVGDPKLKLFRHVAGGAPLNAADAISNLNPGGSDEILFLTDVAGVLFFRGTVGGNSKIYKWAPGDPTVLASHNRTDIVPGGDDGPVWNPRERRGEDSSVINGKLLFTAADGGAYEINASSPVPLGAGDALTGVQGFGDRIVQYQNAYYRVPFDFNVVDGMVYPPASGSYIRTGYPIDGSPTATYYPTNRSGTEFLRTCPLYGDIRMVADGVSYFWAYIPGTDLCSYMATTPAHTAYPGYVVPFPALATAQSELGTTGPAHPWRYDAASGWLLMRGGLSPVRGIHTAKSFAYRDGKLVLLSPSLVGNDDIPGIPRAGTKAVFVHGNGCGGVLDWQTSMVEVNCNRLWRYTP